MDDPAESSTAERGRPSLANSAFEEHRSIITRLYYMKGCTLPDVIQIMKMRHGFSATTKQYKDRLKFWALWKNIRNHEMIHLARIKVHRDADSKSTRFKLRGADVDMTKITRWIKAQRRMLGGNRFRSLIKTEVSTPPEIAYDSGDDDRSTSRSETPDESHEGEVALDLWSNFEAGRQAPWVGNRNLQIRSPLRPMLHENEASRNLHVALSATRVFLYRHAETDAKWRTTSKFGLLQGWGSDLLTWFTLAFQHFYDHDFNNGGRVLRYAFLRIESYLKWHSTGQFLAICTALPMLIANKTPSAMQKEVLFAYLRHTKALLLLEAHPSAYVLSSLLTAAQSDLEQLRHMIGVISGYWGDAFTSLRGTRDRSTLQVLRRNLANVAETQFDNAAMHQLAVDYDFLLNEAIISHGKLHDIAIDLMNEGLGCLEQCHIEPEQFWHRCSEFIARLRERNGSLSPFGSIWAKQDIHLYALCCSRLGKYFHSQGDLDLAVDYYQKSRFLQLQNDLCWVRDAWFLEHLLRRTGRFTEAGVVRSEREILESGYLGQVVNLVVDGSEEHESSE
ncbi:hypothetical protein BKA65DRAFT_559492 [Rhexocercosporidium sp. MPI-PUGE-AT-0058]|nr:hypothetical protein BKA65DRAFT_559492 [Rhexocercosporidium sp. MPI-PUGE-AT-0058]